jgi:hypothetical protein
MKTVTITVELTIFEARAYSQFLKRVGHSDYENKAEGVNDAYNMLFAGDCIREALAKAGFNPR